MNVKDGLLNLKSKLLREKRNNEDIKIIESEDKGEEKRVKTVFLEEKVDSFIKWYYKNVVKGKYTDIGEFHIPKELRNFIEKMAVWYELRYPDYEVNRLMPGSSQEVTKIDEVMFKDNQYINDMFSRNSYMKELEWSKFFNAKVFMDSLPFDERSFLLEPRYSHWIRLSKEAPFASLYLSKDGKIESSENIGKYTNYKIRDDELKGMYIVEIPQFFKEREFELSEDNELFKTLELYEQKVWINEEILNCVMYRIIERGGSRIGPRRAFLFAKEFQRDIDIPIKYGIDYSDPGLRHFINEYIKAGGKKDLECYINYGSRVSNKVNLGMVTIDEILKRIHRYTDEEKELHKKMVNILMNKANHESLKKKKVKKK